MRSPTMRLKMLGFVKTPDGCKECEYRQPEWRDGGWCYMFRVMPAGSCARFMALPAPAPVVQPAAAPAAEGRPQ